MRDRLYSAFVMLLLGIITSCEKSEDVAPSSQVESFKVAIVMPAENQTRWQRTVEWALANIDKAQQGLPSSVELSVEWHDEQAADLPDFLEQVATDEAYVAMIGPMSSTHARQAADAFSTSEKTLLLPIATSAEFQRMYADRSYLWNLTQSDLTQSEILLTQAKLYDYREVLLVTSNSEYGRSFSDWIGYQALELGLTVKEIISYSTPDELRLAVTRIGQSKPNSTMVIFAPDQASDALLFDEQYRQLPEKIRLSFPPVICSDVVNSAEIASSLTGNTYEGISPCADPSSGFLHAYTSQFGSEPINGEAHLYDAVMMLSFALSAQTDQESLNETLLRLLSVEGENYCSWFPDDMCQVFSRLQQGETLKLSGVTGDWTFDERNHSSVLNTIYNHWILREGKFTTLEYLSTDGGRRTTSTLQAWDAQTQNMQSFNKNQEEINYGGLNECWAVVIGASDTWVNYRHQADALAMYQLLKRHGYADDHIILIIEDNIAYDPHNLYPGVIKVSPDGENLYKDVVVDYPLSSLKIEDLTQILCGEKSERLPHVIDADAHDNILFFWCGHGQNNQLAWGSQGIVGGYQIRNLLAEMKTKERYRKMLFAMDACYSGSIGEACKGIPGVLFLTSAHASETSKADMKDDEMGIWLSNGFTRAFQEAIDAQPGISLRDLYYKLARQTVGSHASVYNMENYGNMYSSTMGEFLK